MTTTLAHPLAEACSDEASLKAQIENTIDELISSLPAPELLTPEERRGLIARYSSVLEGNFIYWMTATYLATRSEQARPILIDNLREEIRDCHPAMLRKFAIAAHAFPTDTDALEVNDDLSKVRWFLGRLCGVQSLLTMAFFEGYIQRFMGYLAELAQAQGSSEMEYTDVHGVCDVEHTEGLFRAYAAEEAENPLPASVDPLEGVELLRILIENINRTTRSPLAA